MTLWFEVFGCVCLFLLWVNIVICLAVSQNRAAFILGGLIFAAGITTILSLPWILDPLNIL